MLTHKSLSSRKLTDEEQKAKYMLTWDKEIAAPLTEAVSLAEDCIILDKYKRIISKFSGSGI